MWSWGIAKRGLARHRMRGSNGEQMREPSLQEECQIQRLVCCNFKLSLELTL